MRFSNLELFYPGMLSRDAFFSPRKSLQVGVYRLGDFPGEKHPDFPGEKFAG